MLKCSEKEIKFLESLEEVRLSTYHEEIPHAKPVSFIFHQNSIWIATDYETRSFLNIKRNSNAAIVIDIYKSGENHFLKSLQKIKKVGESINHILK